MSWYWQSDNGWVDFGIFHFLDRFKFSPSSLFRKFLLHTFSIIFTILCCGIIHGWPFLFLILKKQGYFADLCVITNAITDERDCLPQYLKISQIFVVAISTLYISYFQVGGFLFLGLVNDTIFYGIDHYIPGMVMLTVGGYGVFINYIKLSGMYQYGDKSIRAHIFGAQDNSAFILFLFYLLDDHVPIRTFFTYYSMIPAMSAFLSIFFPSHRKKQTTGPTDIVYDSDRVINKFLEQVEQEEITEQQLKWRIISLDFLLIIFFSVIHSFWMNFYILSLAVRIPDPFYIEIFGWIFQGILPLSPWTGWFLENVKISKLLIVIQVLSILFSGLLFIPAIWGQIICFVLYIFYRSLFTNVIFEYVMMHAEFPNWNKFYSVLGVFQGLIHLGLYPMMFLARNFLIINIIQVSTIILSSIIPVIIVWRKRKANVE